MLGPNILPATDLRDVEFLILAEQIQSDYIGFIKAIVIPEYSKNSTVKLREIRILACIGAFDVPVSSSNIAEIMRLDPATVARSMIIMVGDGLVTTTANLNDGRSRLIQLTEKGWDEVNAYNAVLEHSIQEARNFGRIDADENEELQQSENMKDVRDRASRFANAIKNIKRRR